MATLKINFMPTTVGNHIVGWKTFEDANYNTTTVMVESPLGASKSVDIPITGNLYCADDGGIDVDWYIIPQCMDQTDSNSDGVPDLALNGTYNIPQVQDPLKYINIACSVQDDLLLTNFVGGNIINPEGLDLSVKFNNTESITNIDIVSKDNYADYVQAPFVAVETSNYRCTSSQHVSIVSTATSGKGKVIYFPTWDGTGNYNPGDCVVLPVKPNSTIDLGNITSYILLYGTLDVNPTAVIL